MKKLIINSDDKNKRVDAYLIDILEVSRSKVQKMIKSGAVKVNEKEVKNSYTLKENDVLEFSEYEEPTMEILPEEMPLNIVYEDDDVVVINKDNGIVVHPAVGNSSGTLVNGLLYHFKDLSKKGDVIRPGIVHRIDAYTTGLLMVAKNDSAHEFLAKQLEEKTATRKYIALVWGVIYNDTGTIDAPIGRDVIERKKQAVTAINSKDSITHFKVIKRFKDATLIELELETGRTHQIRVHMAYINHPVVNDPVYSKRKLIDESGQCLHAKTLGFIHPTTKKYMEFDSELPKCFTDILNIFESDNINI